MAQLPPLVEAIHGQSDIDDLRYANMQALARCLPQIALFCDGELGPSFLASRIRNSDGWGKASITPSQRRALHEADPLAYLVVGRPEELQELAEAINEE